MKRIKLTLITVAVIVALGAALALSVAEADSKLKLPGLDKGELTEEALNSGAVIAVFWAPWSPKCRGVVDQINDLTERFGKDARVVTVAWQADPDEVRAFLKGQDLAAPVFLDRPGDLSKKYGVTSLPWLWAARDGKSPLSVKLAPGADKQIAAQLN